LGARKYYDYKKCIYIHDFHQILFLFQSWEVLNTAVLTGRQVSQAMKVFIVSRAGKVADVTLQASCRSVEESVLKVE
jgi:transmembrane protein 132